MKLWSKEALVMGGIYGVLDTPFSLLGIEIISAFLFWGFIISIVILCCNFHIKPLQQLIIKYPVSSYYLSAIGWVPYFMIINFMLLTGSGYFVDYFDYFVKYSMGILLNPYTGLCLVLISFITAYIKKLKINGD